MSQKSDRLRAIFRYDHPISALLNTPMEFFTLKTEVIFEEEIKKSRFITYLRHTDGIAAAKAFWAEMRAQHPNARHHCWAAVAGAPNDSLAYGFSDDGEPSGTAGKPMLNGLVGSGLGEISAVVVRYYGGIQLGTGGLVRAYGNGVQQALAQAETVRKVLRQPYLLQCDYDQFNTLSHLFQAWNVEILAQQFGANIQLELGINPTEFAALNATITERFAGKIVLEPQ